MRTNLFRRLLRITSEPGPPSYSGVRARGAATRLRMGTDVRRRGVGEVTSIPVGHKAAAEGDHPRSALRPHARYFFGIRTVSMMLTFALAVLTLPQTTLAESLTL